MIPVSGPKTFCGPAFFMLALLAALPRVSHAQAVEIPPPEEELAGVRSIYVMRMGNGFDQYLASRLAADGLFRVVTHPQEADAVFTDRVGTFLETWIDELAQRSQPATAPAEEEAPGAVGSGVFDARRASVNPESTFGRGRGTFYLVSPKTKTILWSIYHPAKSNSPHHLNRAAAKVTGELTARVRKLRRP